MSHLNDLNTAVAIIGISCRFPDARNPLEFWNNLEAGREALRDLTAAELEAAGVDAATRALPNFVGRGAIVADVDLFDARLFGFTPAEAQILDPQQRIFLQCAWEALEDAGYDPMRYTESIGIFAGADQSGYQFNIYSNPELVASVGQFAITLSNDKDHLTTRAAFTLNLKGPAVTVQTNCSTSLVAVCQACQSLLSYQCDIALAGGSAIAVPQTGGYFSREGGIESPDGHCRTFDALARGTVGGNGAGLVVLKRYDAALADGDQIYAVIRGFATNNDGGDKVSYTAPSIAGQSAAIAAALAMADVDVESIGYIEAHGTGTSLGDPIEMAALTEVFRRHTTRKQFCGVGSVKSNIGHLGSAAGVAALIKTVLALKNRKIPPSLHYQTPNPAIDFKNSPFYVASSLIDWEEGLEPRRAGVSSFGVGGTNAHVVLEEAPVIVTVPSHEWQILPISAKTSSSRDRMTKALTAYLDSEQPPNLADAAYTLQIGRREFAHRQVLLTRPGQRTVISGSGAANPLQVAMLFPGQGSQEVGMAAELYKAEPVFRDCLDECCAKLIGHLGFDLRDVLYPKHPHATGPDLSQTAVAQPALFVIEYALAKLWMDWGVQPSAMAGHSIGEYVAACLSGVFTLEDALALVTERGRLMQSTQPGAMLA
ncbi:type I polyketide synthase, partial [Granulicella sp. S190]|uniref:type I polyketide synthase n=1 Tax=Granulicella sp. S190 TaxID=1747226 RepID=UPI001C2087E3